MPEKYRGLQIKFYSSERHPLRVQYEQLYDEDIEINLFDIEKYRYIKFILMEGPPASPSTDRQITGTGSSPISAKLSAYGFSECIDLLTGDNPNTYRPLDTSVMDKQLSLNCSFVGNRIVVDNKKKGSLYGAIVYTYRCNRLIRQDYLAFGITIDIDNRCDAIFFVPMLKADILLGNYREEEVQLITVDDVSIYMDYENGKQE